MIVLLFSGFYFFQRNKDSASIQTSTTPTYVVKEEPIKDQITQALSQKNNWDASKVEVNVTSVEGDYAKGDVKFKDEMGGGLWFAARTNGIWNIVHDGNGIITCESLLNYKDFPTDLIPQCFDTQNNNIVTR